MRAVVRVVRLTVEPDLPAVRGLRLHPYYPVQPIVPHNDLAVPHRDEFEQRNNEPAESNLSQALVIYRKIDSYEIDAPLNNLGIVYTRTKRLESATMS